MKKEFAEKFSQEVEQYRQTLLLCARRCDWEKFKAKAGNLFDYVEVVEVAEIERKFFRIFSSVLVLLVAVIMAIVNMDTAVHPNLHQLRYSFTVLVVAGISFEMYSYMTFRSFMIAKAHYRKKRKDRFIRGIEQDFREYAMRNREVHQQAA